jgi:UDP-N-acetylmuramyl pentapeptide phosphotransferase/UDP-N-acetylglucosamine-1-phosphate transferase
MMDGGAMAVAEFVLVMTAFLASAGLIILLRPLLRRHLTVQPNARSSHTTPTPQGGGVAVVLAVAIALGAYALLAADDRVAIAGLLPLGAAVTVLAAVGGIDDLVGTPALPRLVLQAVAIIGVLATAPPELRAAPFVPLAAERGVEFLGGLWFVNLVNFMDGIDLMTVTETLAIAAGIFLFSLGGAVAHIAGVTALALGGAMLGFVPFNRPVATLFLGDVGSLPVGLILFWLLLQLAGAGPPHLAAALLLPLYYLADATVTLFWRLARGENLMEAHRIHFYQVATARGMPVVAVIRAVAAVNVALLALAGACVAAASPWVDLAALALGGLAVTALLLRLRRSK